MTEYSAFLKHLGINQKQMIASMMKRIPDSEKLLIECNGLVKRGKTMLIFPLKKEWYEKIKSGEKTIEYREVKPYWIKRIVKACQEWNCQNKNVSVRCEGVFFLKTALVTEKIYFIKPMPCFLQLGYKSETRLKAIITKIEIVDGKDSDLHIDKPVYAIHLTDVREEKK